MAIIPKRRLILLLSAGLFASLISLESAEPAKTTIRVNAEPLHPGRINPMLCGNFIELLDDLVPGMWAEMLNDRSFEGITRPANCVYYDGKPDFCDRPWKTNATWVIEREAPFNGARCAKLTADYDRGAVLSQGGLAIKDKQRFRFSGYLRSDTPSLSVRIELKSLLPTGTWLSLGSAKLSAVSDRWQKFSAEITSFGTSDEVFFALQAEGHGHLWADKLSLMPEENLNGWRPDAIEAIKSTRPAVIRWGGSVCDPGGYRWKNGTGNRDLRTPFPNKVWGRIDSNDVGIDEFCQFCELVQAEPLICLSFSDGPESAGELVQYCNSSSHTKWGGQRSANGHSAPYQVKYWQVGNEIGGDNEDYLRQFGRFVEAMKSADSNVVLAASFPSQKLLQKYGKAIAYIGPHHYTPDFAGCERDFDHLAKMISETPECGHIRIAVTEWNVSAGNWGLLRGKFLTLETALLNARYLNLLMRHSDIVDIACRSNMANSFGSGIIETTPAGLLKRPVFYVMQLYSRHRKPLPLQLNGASPGLDLFTCSTEDKKSLTVFAVNSKKEPVSCAIEFDGFAAPLHITQAEAVCDVEHAGQPDAMNHWTAPDRIKTIPLHPGRNAVSIPALSVAAIDCAR